MVCMCVCAHTHTLNFSIILVEIDFKSTLTLVMLYDMYVSFNYFLVQKATPHLEFTSKLMVTWNPSDFEG